MPNINCLLVLLILASSLSFAQGYDDDDDDELFSLNLTLNSTCSGNIVNVTNETGDPVEAADVTVWFLGGAPIASGQTDGNGSFFFGGCGIAVEIDANKDGYMPVSNVQGQLVNCSECEEDEDEEKELMPLDADLDSGCEGAIITITSSGEAVEGADVTVWGNRTSPVYSGKTDSNGRVPFEGCGLSIEIDVRKEAYAPLDNVKGKLIDCSECEEETVNETEEDDIDDIPGEIIEKEPECYTDDDCSNIEYCDIPPGEIGGFCEPVTGTCGYAKRHMWIESKCGPLGDCPECEEGHACQSEEINGTIVYSCVLITHTPEDLPPVIIEDDGKPGVILEDIFPWLLLLLLAAIILFFLWKRRSKKGKKVNPKKGKK